MKRGGMPFELWRQDDNGNCFLVGTFVEHSAADERMRELTGSMHKQFYWIRERTNDSGKKAT